MFDLYWIFFIYFFPCGRILTLSFRFSLSEKESPQLKTEYFAMSSPSPLHWLTNFAIISLDWTTDFTIFSLRLIGVFRYFFQWSSTSRIMNIEIFSFYRFANLALFLVTNWWSLWVLFHNIDKFCICFPQPAELVWTNWSLMDIVPLRMFNKWKQN